MILTQEMEFINISKYMEKNKEYKFGIKKIEKYVGKNKLINQLFKYFKKISMKIIIFILDHHIYFFNFK